MDYRNIEVLKKIKNFNEVVDGDNWTHFHYICDYNPSAEEIIEYYVGRGADLNIKNNKGHTPFFFICAFFPSEEMLTLCLKNGADLNAKNNKGATPYDYILHFNDEKLLKICKKYTR